MLEKQVQETRKQPNLREKLRLLRSLRTALKAAHQTEIIDPGQIRDIERQAIKNVAENITQSEVEELLMSC